MTYKHCIACKKRISNTSVSDYCSTKCETDYINAEMKYCRCCGNCIGKEGYHEPVYCNIQCHNSHQSIKNRVTRNCLSCGNDFVVQKSSKRRKTCSVKCEKDRAKSAERNNMRMKTLKKNNLERHGVEFTFQRQDTIDNIAKSKLERYGHPAYNNWQKGKQTILEKHGTLNFSKKAIATKLHRYGTLNFNEKGNITKLKKYGTLDFSDKTRATTLAKYGTLDFSTKSKETIVRRYGSWSNLLIKSAYTRLKKKYENVVEFMFTVDEYVGAQKYKKYPFKCLTCNNLFEDYMTNGQSPLCLVCNPKPTHSKFEIEVRQFIESSGLPFEENVRSLLGNGQEVDIWIPSKKLGIECDGVYWHGEGWGKTSEYHLQKTERAAEREFTLLHIFENEWAHQKDIVQSIITSLVGQSKNTMYARNGLVKELDAVECGNFLDINHLQGNDRAPIRYGLFVEDQLVQVMTFKKSRYSKSIQWEMSRFATTMNTRIVGGMSKLWLHFIKTHNPISCVTFADRRYFTGAAYTKLGFKFENYTTPSYFYFKKDVYGLTLESRIKYQKHKLAKLLETFDPNLSEWKNMQANGFDRIWDCGHAKYVWISQN